MSDWIKNFKALTDERAKELQKERDCDIYCRQLIQEKAPLLWARIISQVQEDCAEFNSAFNNDPSREVVYESINNGFQIATKIHPDRKLTVIWSENSSEIDVATVIQHQLDSVRSTTTISFSVSSERVVMMHCQGRVTQDHEQISKHLLMSIIVF